MGDDADDSERGSDADDSAGKTDADDSAGGIDAETLRERMEPLEPYTTGELANLFDAPRERVRELLESLRERDVRKKESEPNRLIWIREPPANECPACGHRFEVKVLHPVLASIRFCPRCGYRL
jgi:DNA-directed RNA polymerase subunit RPC12/RpoP